MIAKLSLLAFTVGCLLGQELSGRWVGTFKVDGGDHGIPQLIILKQNTKQVTGSGGPDDSEQYPISKGSIEGERVHFELTTARASFIYNLTKRGSDLNGRLEIK